MLHLVSIAVGVGLAAGAAGALLGAVEGWNVLLSAAIAVGVSATIAFGLALVGPLTLTSDTLAGTSLGGVQSPLDAPGGAEMDAILLAASVVLCGLALGLYALSAFVG
jgi:hypothetical protein